MRFIVVAFAMLMPSFASAQNVKSGPYTMAATHERAAVFVEFERLVAAELVLAGRPSPRFPSEEASFHEFVIENLAEHWQARLNVRKQSSKV